MNSAILHISDLHFVANADKSKTRFDATFQQRFLEAIDAKNIKYLVVSGDIADKAQKRQYQNALNFLNAIVDRLNSTLDKKNILLCPGNHDIYWDDLSRIIETENIEEEELKNIHKRSEKYNNFKKFYSDFFQELKTFDDSKAIFDKIIDDDDKIMMFGVNTCYRESNQDCDHIGFIDKQSFESELSLNDFQNKYKYYGKFLVMHHNPKDLSTREHSLQNWNEINKDVLGYPYIVLCGHIHGQDGEGTIIKEDNAIVHYISTDCLCKKNITDNNNTFNIYNGIQANELNIKYYALQDKNNIEKYYWEELSNKKAIKKILFRPTPNLHIEKPDALDILMNDEALKQEQVLNKKLAHSKDSKEDIKIQNNSTLDLLGFIKQQNLFKSGHFHWKDGFRAHGFIDINFLVSHKESLELITKHFYNEITENVNKELKNTLMIAIGIECNIIGARLSALFPEYNYSYIPEPSKSDDFEELETLINKEKYDNIILLKDIIFEAEHSKDLLRKLKLSDKTTYLFSLFYCGGQGNEFDLFIEKEFKNIKFHSICNEIVIDKCKYSGESCSKEDSECTIYNNNLQFIYEC